MLQKRDIVSCFTSSDMESGEGLCLPFSVVIFVVLQLCVQRESATHNPSDMDYHHVKWTGQHMPLAHMNAHPQMYNILMTYSEGLNCRNAGYKPNKRIMKLRNRKEQGQTKEQREYTRTPHTIKRKLTKQLLNLFLKHLLYIYFQLCFSEKN